VNIGDKVRFSRLAFAEGIADENSKNMVKEKHDSEDSKYTQKKK
jgi:hypothetical protein